MIFYVDEINGICVDEYGKVFPYSDVRYHGVDKDILYLLKEINKK